ncbi:helix-turn-helix domain-containing protein [Paracoccus sp. Ld10]|uniref:helix-turn-helix domain-containing protein n=1 Tax=Paracoccus sp. Ld10 TaxID=649158 RepID=UPI00386EF991
MHKGLGWSRQQLARRAGTSQGMINKPERGQSSPTIEMVGKLLGCLRHEGVRDRRPVGGDRVARCPAGDAFDLLRPEDAAVG